METTFLLSDALRREFETRTCISLSRLAELLPMDPKTLAEHARRGNIEWRKKGFGSKRPRRVVTQSGVIAFLRRISVRSEDACRTSAEYAAPFPTRTSSAIPGRPTGMPSSKWTQSHRRRQTPQNRHRTDAAVGSRKRMVGARQVRRRTGSRPVF
jgi:hypothetical protein